MEKRKLIKSKQINSTTPLFWMLPGTQAPSEQSYKHQRDIGDLYVALCPFADWLEGKEFEGIKPDAIVYFKGLKIMLEVDRGNEFKKLLEKLDNYVRFLRKSEGYVIFSLVDGKRTAKATGHVILDYLQEKGLVYQALVSFHSLLVSAPLTAPLVSPTAQRTLEQLT